MCTVYSHQKHVWRAVSNRHILLYIFLQLYIYIYIRLNIFYGSVFIGFYITISLIAFFIFKGVYWSIHRCVCACFVISDHLKTFSKLMFQFSYIKLVNVNVLKLTMHVYGTYYVVKFFTHAYALRREYAHYMVAKPLSGCHQLYIICIFTKINHSISFYNHYKFIIIIFLFVTFLFVGVIISVVIVFICINQHFNI